MSKIDLAPYYVKVSLSEESEDWIWQARQTLDKYPHVTVSVIWSMRYTDRERGFFMADRRLLVKTGEAYEEHAETYQLPPIATLRLYRTTDDTLSLYDTDGGHYIAEQSTLSNLIKVDDCFTSIADAVDMVDGFIVSGLLEVGITSYDLQKMPAQDMLDQMLQLTGDQ